jgi:hypothetical protein
VALAAIRGEMTLAQLAEYRAGSGNLHRTISGVSV